MKKLLFDFFPVILFFAAFQLEEDPTRGIMTATAVLIVATALQMGWMWFRHGRIERMHAITLVLVVGLGGLTLWLNDERFIKWKPTLVNWAFALAFAGSRFVGSGKSIVERLMGSQIELPSGVWNRLNWGWIVFFVGVGALNLWVAQEFSTDFWVNFKLFGMLGLTLVFILGQTAWLMYQVKRIHGELDS